jgi:hypothetical protein
MRALRPSLVLLVLLGGILAPGRAAAAPPPPPPEAGFTQAPQRFALPERTVAYDEQTPEPRQLEADRLFQQGNRSFEKRQLDDAIRLYRQAYAIWPHPIILFNMAINLGFLSNPLGAATMFRKVLAYAPGPISQERYTEAAQHYKTLMAQLSVLRVVCSEPGATLFVDGRDFGKAPLDRTVTLGPGRHMVTAKAVGKVPYSAELVLKEGHEGRLVVRLQDFVDIIKTRTVSRYAWWIPTVVTLGAVAAGGLGAGLWATGRSDVTSLKEAQRRALELSQSRPIAYDTAREDRAVSWQYAGQVLVGAAATAATAAVVLWALRRKRERFTVEMTPTPGGAGVNFTF